MARQKKPKRWRDEDLRELVFTAVGAASVPLWQTHPNDVFPSTEVAKAVDRVLEEFGVPQK